MKKSPLHTEHENNFSIKSYSTLWIPISSIPTKLASL